MQHRFSLMGNRSFLIGILFVVGFCYVVYLAYDSNSKLRVARERVDYAKHEYDTLSVQVQQLLDQKAKLEKQLQSERNELRKVKDDKDYIEQERKDLFSKLQSYTQTEKTLKAQQEDLQQKLEKANRELADIKVEKENGEKRNQAEFAQLGTEKELEIAKLRDELADLKRRYDEARANLGKGGVVAKASNRDTEVKQQKDEPEELTEDAVPVETDDKTGTKTEREKKDEERKSVEPKRRDTAGGRRTKGRGKARAKTSEEQTDAKDTVTELKKETKQETNAKDSKPGDTPPETDTVVKTEKQKEDTPEDNAEIDTKEQEGQADDGHQGDDDLKNEDGNPIKPNDQVQQLRIPVPVKDAALAAPPQNANQQLRVPVAVREDVNDAVQPPKQMRPPVPLQNAPENDEAAKNDVQQDAPPVVDPDDADEAVDAKDAGVNEDDEAVDKEPVVEQANQQDEHNRAVQEDEDDERRHVKNEDDTARRERRRRRSA